MDCNWQCCSQRVSYEVPMFTQRYNSPVSIQNSNVTRSGIQILASILYSPNINFLMCTYYTSHFERGQINSQSEMYVCVERVL